MHCNLCAQLKSLKLSDSARQTITPLCSVLDVITRAGEEEEGDQLTSTIEALRVMQSTITQFGAATIPRSGENSESSSEYTTPAQSQATSPSHEQSPPPAGSSIQEARATVSSAARLITMQTSTGVAGDSHHHHHHHQSSVSPPSVSPTHGEKLSTLATHSHSAYPLKAHTMSDRGGGASLHPAETGGTRRKSESEIQKHRTRPSSQQLANPLAESARQLHSRSIDFSIT